MSAFVYPKTIIVRRHLIVKKSANSFHTSETVKLEAKEYKFCCFVVTVVVWGIAIVDAIVVFVVVFVCEIAMAVDVFIVVAHVFFVIDAATEVVVIIFIVC